MDKTKITIIGAGAVGLAIATELSQDSDDILVLEKNEKYGQEISSRNSEVLHAGIYYPPGSLKAKLCIEGNEITRKLCEEKGLPIKAVGKIIFADKTRLEDLESTYQNALACGLKGLKRLRNKEIKELEPNIEAEEGIYSPTTAIISAHSLMDYFAQQLSLKGISLAHQTEVIDIEKTNNGYKVSIKDSSEEIYSFETEILINCTGLNCDKIAAMAGIDIDKYNYRLKYCKGDYFKISDRKRNLVKHLVYPTPGKKYAGLGIHTTIDLGGSLKLGPNAYYIDRNNFDYNVDVARKDEFYNSAKQYLPSLEYEDLTPEMSGVRPKLQGPSEDVRDFVISHEKDKGFFGLINLIGIESPGLTAATAIARYVAQMVKSII